MATTQTITTSYAGESASKYVAAALLSGVTIDNGGIEIMPNIKFKSVVQKLGVDDVIKDASCDFDPTSTVTISERIIQPEFQQVNLQLCKKDYISTFMAQEMGFSAHNDLPSNFADFLIGHVAAKVAEKTEQNIWRGVTANNGEFDGLTTLMAADSDVVDVSSTTVTSSNVIGQLGAILDAAPSALFGQEDLTLYVSRNIYQAYIRALGGFAANGVGAAGYRSEGTNQALQPTFFDGVRLFLATGLADNRAVLSQKSNLYFGTGLLADHNEVKVIDMADIDGSDNVRIVMRFSAGVQYGIGSDIVLYS
tara:strand:+ start:1250 stop:2173 length:924 start_codon:yes stop_codon:yes gene_type:complete